MLNKKALWQAALIVLCWTAIVLWNFKYIAGIHSFSELLSSTKHLDVLWYEKIALHGYELNPNSTEGQSPVFFPLFPFLAAPLIHFFKIQPLLALNIVQKLCLVGMCYLAYYWSKLHQFSAKESLLAVLLHPALVFLFVPYTESLYLACLFGLLIAWHKSHIPIIFCSAFLLGLCRPTGLFLLPAAGVSLFIMAFHSIKSEGQNVQLNSKSMSILLADTVFRRQFQLLAACVAGAVLAVFFVAVVMKLSVGDWFAFYRYRALWKENPSLWNLVEFLNPDFGSRFPRFLIMWLTVWGSFLLVRTGRVFEGIFCLVSMLLPAYQGKMGDIIRYSLSAAPAWIMLHDRCKSSRIAQMALVAFSISIAMLLMHGWLKRDWAG